MLIAETTAWYGTPFAGFMILYLLYRLNSQNSDEISSNTSDYMKVRLSGTGNSSSSQTKLKQLARQGHASSLATFTWYGLLNGNHSQAIALFEQTRHSQIEAAGGSSELPWELANCDSNHALNLLASGKQLKDVRMYWDRNLNKSHFECDFYSIMTKVRLGERQPIAIQHLSKKCKNSMLKTLSDGSKSQGWYKNWCLEILRDFGNELRI